MNRSPCFSLRQGPVGPVLRPAFQDGAFTASFSLRHARMGFRQKGSCSKTAQIYLNYLDNALFHALFVKFITVVSRSFRLRVPAFRFCAVPRFAGFSLRAEHRSSSHKKNNRQRIRQLFRIVVPKRSFSVLFSVLPVSAFASIPVPVSRSSTPASSGAFGSFLRLRHLLCQGSFSGPFLRLLRLRFRLFASLSPVLSGPFLRFLSPVSAPFRPLFGPVS